MNVVKVRQCSMLCTSGEGVKATISGYGAAGDGEGFSQPSSSVKGSKGVEWDDDWKD